MNTKQHGIIGLIAATGVYFFFAVFGILLEPMVVWLMATIGGIAPDFIEQPGKVTHRGKFHSKKALQWSGLVTLLGLGITMIFNNPYSAAVLFFGLGYFLHLFADGFGKTGLEGFDIGHRLGPKSKINEWQIKKIIELNPSKKRDYISHFSYIEAQKMIEELKGGK